MRLWSSFAAASLSSARAASTAAESRRARTPWTRSICLRSSAGSIRRISISPSPPSVIGVHADQLALPGVVFLLERVGRIGDLALRIAALDRLHHPAQLVDLGEVLIRQLLHPIGQRLHEIRAAERIDRVRHPRLVRDDLLRAQRHPHRLLARQRQRLIMGVGVQRLRPAEHPRERLDRRPRDVVQRLLSRQRHPGRLRVKTHQPRLLLLGAERLAQLTRPDPPRRPILRDLLEEIDMRIEEEATTAARSHRHPSHARPAPRHRSTRP